MDFTFLSDTSHGCFIRLETGEFGGWSVALGSFPAGPVPRGHDALCVLVPMITSLLIYNLYSVYVVVLLILWVIGVAVTLNGV